MKAARQIPKLVLTPEQKEIVRQTRAAIERERPEVVAEARRIRAAQPLVEATLRDAFAALKAERLRQSLSLTDVATRIGMTRHQLSRLETSADSNPTISTVVRVAEALGKTIHITLDPAVVNVKHGTKSGTGKVRRTVSVET